MFVSLQLIWQLSWLQAPAVSLRRARDKNDYLSWHWVIGYIQYMCARSFRFYFWWWNAIDWCVWHMTQFDCLFDLLVYLIYLSCVTGVDFVTICQCNLTAEQGTQLKDNSITSITNYVIIKILNLWDEPVISRETATSIISANAQ